MDNNTVVKKAKEFLFMSQSVAAQDAPAFFNRVNSLLAQGWDLFASQTMGLDTGGGVGGSGNVMVYITLVKYEYLKIVDTPLTADAAG